jgi:hypothetical protein
MVVALVCIEPHYPRLLQQIPIDVRARNLAGAGEFDPNELSETGRIVISNRLRVSKGFEDGIGSEDLLGQVGEIAASRPRAWCVRVGDGSEVLDDFLRVLSFTRTRFSAVVC